MTWHMPKWLAAVICIIAAALALYWGWAREFMAIDRCLDDGGGYEELWQTCEKSGLQDPSVSYHVPIYTGVLDGKKVKLKLRSDSSAYRMDHDGLHITGDLKTERGFDGDDNATVYVLNAFAQAHRQIRFLVSKNGKVDELVRIGPDQRLQKESVLRAR